MSRYCKGCGVKMQSEDIHAIGYTPKQDGEYCQRCFRITHYDDMKISMQQGIDNDEVLRKIASMDAFVLWVVDLFDFEANIVKGMNRHLKDKEIVLVASKRDLLPESMGNNKIIQFIYKRLKFYGIEVKGIIICGGLAANASIENNDSVFEIQKVLNGYANDKDIVVMGMANAGKSTILNAVVGNSDRTTSRYPGTTLDFIDIAWNDHKIIDTPGLTRYDSLLTHVDAKMLKQVIPMKTIKPVVFQLQGSQSLAVGGFLRLDLDSCEDVTCVCYFSDQLTIHRGKLANADVLWETQLHKLLIPTLNESFNEMKAYEHGASSYKLDVVIHGLGFFSIQGDLRNIKVYVNSDINVTFREAMI
ncbi:MAG: GTPase [Erysipelotrichaceae bacterium]